MIYEYMKMKTNGESPKIGVFTVGQIIDLKKFNMSETEADGFVGLGNAVYVVIEEIET